MISDHLDTDTFDKLAETLTEADASHLLLEIPDPETPGYTYHFLIPLDELGQQCRHAILDIERARSEARAQYDASKVNDPAAWRRLDVQFTQRAVDTYEVFRATARVISGAKNPHVH